MKKHHFLFKIWRVSYPMVIHYGSLIALTFIGGLVISIAISYQTSAQDVSLSKNLIEYILSNQVLRYAVLLTGLGNLAAIPLLSLFMRLDKVNYPEGNLIEKAHPATYIFAVLSGFFFCIGLNQVLTLSQLARYFNDYNNTMASIYIGNIWEEILCVAILAPIGEELCFRGLVFKRLRGYIRFVPAMLISSLLFGIYHGNVLQGCYAFCLGCVLAYIHEKYQNVLAPIIVHVVANTVSVISTETTWLNFLFMNWSTVITSMIVCLICGILILIAIKLTVKTEREEYIPPYIPPTYMPGAPAYMLNASMGIPNAPSFAGYAAPCVPIRDGNMNLQATPLYTTLPDGISPNGITCPVGMMTPQGFVPLYYLTPSPVQAPPMQTEPMTPEPEPTHAELLSSAPAQDDSLLSAPPQDDSVLAAPTQDDPLLSAPPQDDSISLVQESTEDIVKVPAIEIPSAEVAKAEIPVSEPTADTLIDEYLVQEFELGD